MPVAKWERRAALTGFVTAVLVVASYAYSLPVVPDVGEGLAVWMRLPPVLLLLVIAGIPMLAGWLLLGERASRRQVGAAVLGAFGLLTAVYVPRVLAAFPFGVEAAAVVHQLLSLAYMLSASAAGGFAIAALAVNPAVAWHRPWRSAQSRLRMVLGAAIVLTAVGLVAPTTRSAVEGLAGGLALEVGWAFAGGLDLSALGWLSLRLLLPVLGVVAVGVAAAGLWPARVMLGAGAVVAAEGVVNVVATAIDSAVSPLLWDEPMALTGWYWVHVAVVAALAATLFVAWRTAARHHDEHPVGTRPG